MTGTALQAASIYKKYTSDNNSCIAIVDSSGSINYVNDNFCNLTGYLREELIGKNNKIIDSKFQSKAYLASIYDELNKGNVWLDEFKNINKNGEYYWVDRTIIPFLDTENKTEMYVNIYVNITDNKKTISDIFNPTFEVDKNSIIAKTDKLGTITYVNDNFCKITGYLEEELIGQNHRLLNSGNKDKDYWKSMYKAISKGNIWQDEVRNKDKSGNFYWVDTTIIPHIGVDKKPESYISIRTDITKQKELSSALIKHKFAMDQHAIIATTDIAGNITYANDKFIDISGYSQKELIGQNHRILNSGNRDKSYWKEMYQNVSHGNIWKDQVENISKSGSYYWVDTTIIPFMDNNGKPNSYFSIRTDITYQKKIEEILSNQRFAMNQHSIIAITNVEGSITYANDKFCNISGYTEEELLGQNHRLLNSHNKPSSYWKEMYKILEEKGIWQDEVKNRSKNGEYYWVDTTIIPFLDSNGTIDNYISIRTDITKYKLIQEKLEEYQNNLEKIVHERTLELAKANDKLKLLSEIDVLTNLANRRKLDIDFAHKLKHAQGLKKTMALFFLDLDKFKKINDTHGHLIGDSLLQIISNKLQNCLKEDKYLYRIGGDEFCILIPNFTTKEELKTLAKRLIIEISEITSIESFEIDIGCSIGISLFPEDGNTLEELISTADNAMYFVKNSGKNNYSFSNNSIFDKRIK